MSDFSRTQRVADFLKKELGTLIQLQIRDPRVGMVSITDVEVSRDLSHAKVFVTVMNSGLKNSEPNVAEPLGELDKLEIEENLKALNKAAGYLRSLLAKRLRLRTTPRLQFFYDGSIVRGQQLSSLIDEAIAADRQIHD